MSGSERGLWQVLRDAGTSFVLLGLTGRMPPAMLPLGLTLYTYAQLDSFTSAGAVVAAVALGNAAGGPLVGAAADRWGQRISGLVSAALTTAALAVLVVMLRPGVPMPLLVALAFLTGTGNPQVGAMARGRWAAAARQRTDRARMTSLTMAYEGAIDEAAFVVGPVTVSMLALLGAPVPLIVAGVLGLVLPVAFALHPTALPPGSHHVARDDEPTRVPWLRLVPVGLVCAAIGVIFGSVSTGVTAFLTERGQEGITGFVYGGMGIGSATSALLSTRVRASQRHKLVGATLGLSLVAPWLILAGHPLLLSAVCFLCGCFLAPALIAAFAIGESTSPLARISTVMTALGTCVTVGVATGASAAGPLIDSRGAVAALAIPTVAGVSAALAGLVNLAISRRARG